MTALWITLAILAALGVAWVLYRRYSDGDSIVTATKLHAEGRSWWYIAWYLIRAQLEKL